MDLNGNQLTVRRVSLRLAFDYSNKLILRRLNFREKDTCNLNIIGFDKLYFIVATCGFGKLVILSAL